MRPFVVARSVRGQDRSWVGSCSCLCRGCCCTARHEEVPKGRLEDRFRRFAGGQCGTRAVWTQTGLLSQPVGEDAESVRMIWTGGHLGLTSGAFGRGVLSQTGIGGCVCCSWHIADLDSRHTSCTETARGTSISGRYRFGDASSNPIRAEPCEVF